MDLHGRIMNIQVDKEKLAHALDESVEPRMGLSEMLAKAYRLGHRDARHAEAELIAGEEWNHDDSFPPISTAPKDGTKIMIYLGTPMSDWDHPRMYVLNRQVKTLEPTQPKEPTAPIPEVDVVGVHASHCCKVHGCKYGDEDCPVEMGEVEQRFECDNCEADKRERDEIIAKYEDPLRSYEVELGILPRTFTLGKLIKAHRRLLVNWRKMKLERETAFNDASWRPKQDCGSRL